MRVKAVGVDSTDVHVHGIITRDDCIVFEVGIGNGDNRYVTLFLSHRERELLMVSLMPKTKEDPLPAITDARTK